MMRDDMLFFAYPALALLLASSPSHAAQNVSFDNPTHMTSHIHDVGKACNVNRTRLAPDSNQLQGDCGYLAWCDPSTNTCKVNGCRTDEYPFGYNNIDKKVWPPRCGRGQFCPDEFSFCMDKNPVGGPCQLSRDDQCVSAEQGTKPICLHNVCQLINATEGSQCLWENTIYTDYVSLSDTYGDVISRDNCMAGLYCDVPTSRCLVRKSEGQACSADKECGSSNCLDPNYTSETPINNNATGTCGPVVYTQLRGPKPYIYVVVVLGIVIAAVILCASLMRLHQKQRLRKNTELRQYWEEQRLLRRKLQLAREEVLLMAQQRSHQNSPAMSLSSLPGGFNSRRSSAINLAGTGTAVAEGSNTVRRGANGYWTAANDSMPSSPRHRLGAPPGDPDYLYAPATPLNADAAAAAAAAHAGGDEKRARGRDRFEPADRERDHSRSYDETDPLRSSGPLHSRIALSESKESFNNEDFVDAPLADEAATSSAIDPFDPSSSRSRQYANGADQVSRNRLAAANSLAANGNGASKISPGQSTYTLI